MSQLENKIVSMLADQGASLIRFVDVSELMPQYNRGLPNAIFLGIALTSSYVRKVMETAGYVQTIIAQNEIENDEFYLTEIKAGKLADLVAGFLISNGYQAYSQSDDNLIATEAFDEKEKRTLLPHKTVAVLAGVGWIGKNNLLITPEYGPALCLGTVLTDAPLEVIRPQITENKCGACKKCVNVCQPKALLGGVWGKNVPRESLVDVYKCTTCMKCLVHCSYSQRYVRQDRNANK